MNPLFWKIHAHLQIETAIKQAKQLQTEEQKELNEAEAELRNTLDEINGNDKND